MSELAAQQQALVDALWRTAGSETGRGPARAPGARICVEPPASPAARLDVYRRSFQARLAGCLERDFPRVRAVLGESAFGTLATAYLRRHPPSSAALRDLGRDFPAFVAERGPNLGEAAELAADLARLEWAWVEVFDAADRVPLELEAVARVPPAAWPALRFEISPASRIERFRFRVDRFALDEPSRRPEAAPTELSIWRKAHRVFVRPLDRREARALAAARAGAPFGAICEAATRADESVEIAAARVVELLRRWIDDHLVVGLRHPQSSERSALEEQTEEETKEET